MRLAAKPPVVAGPWRDDSEAAVSVERAAAVPFRGQPVLFGMPAVADNPFGLNDLSKKVRLGTRTDMR